MTSLDFAPLFRTAIGFDRLARLVDTATASAEVSSYPPYNIERTGDDFVPPDHGGRGLPPRGP